MVVDYPTAYRAVKVVLQNHEGRNTVKSSLKCGAITGFTTLGACLLLGPVGVVAGAALGSTVAYAGFKDEFKSLFQVFEEDMSEEEKKELIEEVQLFISKLSLNDAGNLIALLQGKNNIELSLTLLGIIKDFICTWQESQKLRNSENKTCITIS